MSIDLNYRDDGARDKGKGSEIIKHLMFSRWNPPDNDIVVWDKHETAISV